MLGWMNGVQGWQIQPSIPAPLLLKAYTNHRHAQATALQTELKNKARIAEVSSVGHLAGILRAPTSELLSRSISTKLLIFPSDGL